MLNIHSIYYDDISNPAWSKPLSATDYDILMLIFQGKLIYRLNEVDIVLNKGDIVYIPAGTMRQGIPIEGFNHQKYSIHFTMDSESISEYAPLLNRISLYSSTRQFDYLKQRFHMLAQQWIGKMSYYYPLCRSMLQEILAIACRDYDEARFPSKKLVHVKVLQQYILDHYTKSIRIETLAALVDRTPNYVTSIFREITGQTPIEYLHQIRISAARDMLLNSRMTIGEIAEKLGFCDQSYFNRVYKKQVGYPPSALLKERKESSL